MTQKDIDTKYGKVCPTCRKTVSSGLFTHIQVCHGDQVLAEVMASANTSRSELRQCPYCERVCARPNLYKHVKAAHGVAYSVTPNTSFANNQLNETVDQFSLMADPDRSSTPTMVLPRESVDSGIAQGRKPQVQEAFVFPPPMTLAVRPTGLVIPELRYSGDQLRRAVQRIIELYDTEGYTVGKVAEVCQTEMPDLNPSIHRLVAEAITITAQQVASLSQYSAAIRSAEKTDKYRQTLEQITILTRGPRMEQGPRYEEVGDGKKMAPRQESGVEWKDCGKQEVRAARSPKLSGNSPLLAGGPSPPPLVSGPQQRMVPVCISPILRQARPLTPRVASFREELARLSNIRADLEEHVRRDLEEREEDFQDGQNINTPAVLTSDEDEVQEIPGTPQPLSPKKVNKNVLGGSKEQLGKGSNEGGKQVRKKEDGEGVSSDGLTCSRSWTLPKGATLRKKDRSRSPLQQKELMKETQDRTLFQGELSVDRLSETMRGRGGSPASATEEELSQTF